MKTRRFIPESRLLAVKWIHFILQVSCFMVLSCYHTPEPKMTDKFDAPLRLKIQEISRNRQADSIGCFIKLQRPLNAEIKSQLERCGLRVRTAVKTIVTANGRVEALQCAARLEVVQSISLSQEADRMP